MGNTATAQQCRLGLFQDSDFARDLEDSKSTSVEILCTFASHTFVPISWVCKRQASVSHSSTESEIIFLEVLHSSSNQPKKSTENVLGNLLHDTPSRQQTKNQVITPIQYNDLELCNVDYASQSGAMLYIFLKIMKQ